MPAGSTCCGVGATALRCDPCGALRAAPPRALIAGEARGGGAIGVGACAARNWETKVVWA